LKVTVSSVLQTVGGISMLLILFTGSIFRYVHFKIYNENFLAIAIWSWILKFGFLTFLIQCIYQVYNMEEIKTFFGIMNSIDLKLQSMSLVINHSKYRKIVRNVCLFLGLLMMLRIPVIIFIYGFIIQTFTMDALFAEIMFCFFIIYECLLCLQFIIPTFLVRERFKIIRNFVR
jgi:hypothetical protein